MILNLVLAAGLAAWPGPAAEGGPLLLVQRKPHDRGNCFQWQGCRGDSIGNMWIHAPDFCAALGGRSWLDEETGRCHNLKPGPKGRGWGL
ncbi:MAG: hypothetical protein LBV70_05060 [Candidatus Adiutrix sp.]|jgi:hypothetical protein|nr:hypothetical protein [Candidatus Adiutrix sp.]